MAQYPHRSTTQPNSPVQHIGEEVARAGGPSRSSPKMIRPRLHRRYSPNTAAFWISIFSVVLLIVSCLVARPGFAQEVSATFPPTSYNLPAHFDKVFTRHFTGANGVRLHYVIGGPDEGETVVLLHGWPETWYVWRRIMPALAEAGYRVVAVDYRGAGDSEKPQGGYDKATMAADIRALVHQLGREKVNLISRDIGLMVAYAYSAQWPNEVTRLVLLDVAAPGTKAWERAKREQDPQIWHFGFHQQPDIPEMLVTGREYEYIADFYKDRLYVPGAVTEEDIAVYARAYASPGGLRAGFMLYRAFPEDERRFKQFMTKKLSMPVLALGGEMSGGPMVAEMARELAKNVRGGVAPETGHWLPEENPDYLLAQLQDFFGKAP